MTSDWLSELSATVSATYEFFAAIPQFEPKELTELHIEPRAPCPSWCDGKIRICPQNEARSVAHEIGHGYHEKIREAGYSDLFGEDFAETIRWFVEYRMGPSSWCEKFRSQAQKDDRILEFCNYNEDLFRESLATGMLFTKLRWKRT